MFLPSHTGKSGGAIEDLKCLLLVHTVSLVHNAK